MKKLCSTLLLWLFFLAYSYAQSNPTTSINALRNYWKIFLRDKQLEKAMNLYTDDAVFFSPQSPAKKGKPAIRKLFTQAMKAYNSNIEFQNYHTVLYGSMAYENGEYTETLLNNATKQKLALKGCYLMILKRQSTGQWQIVQQMWTTYK